MQVSVLLPVMDEDQSLRETVAVLLRDSPAVITQILILTSPRSTPPALAAAAALQHQHPGRIEVRQQTLPYLGGALRDGFRWAQGTHVLMMASDLETDPALAKDLIAAAAGGADIVTATRWVQGGGFEGYSPSKQVLNRIFQALFARLYGVRLTDLTYGYRIFAVRWVKTVRWEELRHAFLLETLLKPLRLGARVVELPAQWRRRNEGTSHNPPMQNLLYVRLALTTRFRRRRRLVVAA